jgi:hypothetical protein
MSNDQVLHPYKTKGKSNFKVGQRNRNGLTVQVNGIKSKATAAETEVSAPLEVHYDSEPVPLLFNPHNLANTVSMPFQHILDLPRRSQSNFCMYSVDPLLQLQ